MTLIQRAFAVTPKGYGRKTKATFRDATGPGNTLIAVLVAGGGTPAGWVAPAGWVLAKGVGTPDMDCNVWYLENAPATTSVEFYAKADRSVQMQLMEHSGIRLSSSLDFAIWRVAASYQSTAGVLGSTAIDTGLSANTAQADSTVLAVIASRNPATTQGGFSGGFTQLFDSVTPKSIFGVTNADTDRTRLTVHQVYSTAIAKYRLLATLSAAQQWVAILLCFKGGSTGAKRLSSVNQPGLVTFGELSGKSVLTAFGPLRSGVTTQPALIAVGGTSRIDTPFSYQYRVGPSPGVLLGQGTNYDVVEVDGLEGADMRVSDADQPRSDGALRGTDLQAARLIQFEIELAGDLTNGVEVDIDTLFRALAPQRDTDWPLVFRHPTRGVKFVNCRPIMLPRILSHDGTVLARQKFTLRAADPRHYSATQRSVTVPITAAGATSPTTVNAPNSGNANAYPVIEIQGPASGTVTRVQLVNQTSDVTFDVALPLTSGSVLTGDMPARVTAAPRSPITLDGQSKYGAWAFPREPFYITPGGADLYCKITPDGTSVTVRLTYRDTWSG